MGGSGKLAITTETETEKRRCLPKHRSFSCYDFCGGSRSRRRTPHYLEERGTQTFSFLISKVQTRRRHPSSSPMTDCCNYSGILSDGGGGAPAECCLIFFRGGRDQIRLLDFFTCTANSFYHHTSSTNETEMRFFFLIKAATQFFSFGLFVVKKAQSVPAGRD